MSEEKEPDFRTLPLEQRLTHKVWKARQSAYLEYSQIFQRSASENDECFQTFISDPNLVRGMIVDSNMVAQEAGIKAVGDFVQYGGVNASLRTRSFAVKALIEKGLGATRAGTKQASIDALLWYIELDTPDPVVEEIYPFLSHKMPKMIVASTAALTVIFNNFGAKLVTPKPAVQVLPKLFSHTDKNVRAEATKLAVELYRWLGDGFAGVLFPELKPIQQKELEGLFKTAKANSPEQLRLLRYQKEALGQQQSSGSTSESNNDISMAGVEPENEEMDFVEAVDVTGKIPAGLYEKLNSKLWKERKAVLEELVPVLNVPKIQNADFGELTRALAKCMKDANIMVVTLAANSITSLATGLKFDFHRYGDTVLGPTLERTKERKATVLEALHTALDAIFKTSNLSDILPVTLEMFEHKTPQVKIESAKFLVRCLKTTKTPPRAPEVKSIAEAAVILTSDSQEAGRTSGSEVLGVLMKIVGERPLNPFVDKLEDLKKNKVKEFFQSAEVIAKPESAAPPTRTPAPTNSAASRVPTGAHTPSRTVASRTPARTIPARTPIRNAPGGGLKRRMISPVKPASVGSSSASSSLGPALALSRDPSHNLASASSRLQTSNGGLANRVLGRAGAASSSTGGGAVQSRAVDSRMLAELEQLRGEKEQWQAEKQGIISGIQESETEKIALQKIINELEVANAELREQNTQDMLALKSKETQLIRTQSDLETARTRISRLEIEVERLNARYNSATSLTGGASAEIDSTAGATQGLRRLTLARSGERNSQILGSPHLPKISRSQFDSLLMSGERRSPQSKAANPRPMSMFAGSFDFTDKENSVDGGSSSGSNAVKLDAADMEMEEERGNEFVEESNGDRGSTNSGIPVSTGRPAENWKRAAHITADLRSRIESMKRHAS